MNLAFEGSKFILTFDMIGTLAVGLISLYIGKIIKEKTNIFDKFAVPAAVLGGLIFALVHLFFRSFSIGSIVYTGTLQDPFMLVFFTTIGLSSSIAALKRGGKLLVIFWLASGFMTFMQTVIGVSLAKATGISPLLGVLAGSVSMSGGHGSAGAFGKTVEALGVTGASAMALSSATFGLVAGGLLGAPLALAIIKKYNLKPEKAFTLEEVSIEERAEEKKITGHSLTLHILVLSVIMTVGATFSQIINKEFKLSLPSYVGAMIVAIIFNNLNKKYNWFNFDRNLLEILSEASLNIFLSMALISLKLWELYDLAIPMLIILMAQVLFMWLYTRFIVFKLLGSDYDAAVMISGMCGSGLGATSNAMINMGEVSSKYGYTVNPYLIVPLTGAFLIDIFQMPVIVTAINLFK